MDASPGPSLPSAPLWDQPEPRATVGWPQPEWELWDLQGHFQGLLSVTVPGVSSERVPGCPSPPGQPHVPIPEGCRAPSFPAAAVPGAPRVSTGLRELSPLEQGAIHPGFLSSDATVLDADHSQPSQR